MKGVSLVCFEGRINLSEPLLPMVWADSSYEEHMHATERDQNLLDFKNSFDYVTHI